MKLKTKFQDEDFELGEIVEANIYHGGNGRIKVIAEPAKGGMITFYFETLKGMNEMFEDYEEPKEYWYIDYDGGILCGESDNSSAERMMISMGNHFSSIEEAEKTVEKLKAWKRLKDKGFRFTLAPGVGALDVVPGKFQIDINADMPEKWFCCDPVQKDLDLLFCSEDNR